MQVIKQASRAAAFGVALSAAAVEAQATGPVAVAQHTEALAPPPPVEAQTLVNLAAGATLNGGNTEAYAANGGGRLSVIRHPHQLNVELLGTLGFARNATTTEVEQTSANVIGRARYDLFLSRMDALFLAVAPRRDTFAGLNIRLQNQAGYLRNLYFADEAHRLWTELGYDLTYDDFAEITTTTVETNPADVITALPDNLKPDRNETITRTTTVTDDPGHDVVHSARLFVGYTNTLRAFAALNLGVETLLDVEDKENVRVNGTAEINSSLSERFKLGIQFRVLFDNVPVEGVAKKYDTITALQLIYTYDSLAGAAAAPACPACDCSADVAAARAACAVAEPAPAPAPMEPVPPPPAAPAATPAEAAEPVSP
jgi:putative salt-induced outer membrane protein YdiY